jgi:hemerythrin-like domain-containing protein/rubredoxin
MLPIGPLMREHRLIERMVALARIELAKAGGRPEGNLGFIDGAIEFFRTYADRCHHGKEEDILFKELRAKQLSKDDRKVMDELIEEHSRARKVADKLSKAKTCLLQGDESASNDIEILLRQLAQLYPGHIEKEDKHFFYPCMKYFAAPELDAMLQRFWEFDRTIIHEKYEEIVADGEKESVTLQAKTHPTQKWKCTVCGYIYDPENGDPEHGVAPGTAFDQVPEDWVCPICYAPKKRAHTCLQAFPG